MITHHTMYLMDMVITDRIVVLNAVQSVIRTLPEETKYNTDEFKSKCLRQAMKDGRGSLNPMMVMNEIDNLLSKV